MTEGSGMGGLSVSAGPSAADGTASAQVTTGSFVFGNKQDKTWVDAVRPLAPAIILGAILWYVAKKK